MRHSQVNLARFLVAHFQKALNTEFKAIDSRRALSQQTTGFVNQDHSTLLKQNIGGW